MGYILSYFPAKSKGSHKEKRQSGAFLYDLCLGIRRFGYGSLLGALTVTLAVAGLVALAVALVSQFFLDLTVCQLVDQPDDTEGGSQHAGHITDHFKYFAHNYTPLS